MPLSKLKMSLHTRLGQSAGEGRKNALETVGISHPVLGGG